MPERYQGFTITLEPHRDVSMRSTGCVAWAYLTPDEPTFGINMLVADRYMRAFYPNESPEKHTTRAALRWVHGLIDTESWQPSQNAVSVHHTLEWVREWNSTLTDHDIEKILLTAFARMDRLGAIGYAPRLDVEGLADVLGIDPKRVRGVLAELTTRRWIASYGYEERPTEGEARITDAGYRRLDEITATPTSELTSTLDVADYIASGAFRDKFPQAVRGWEHAMSLLTDRPLRSGIIGYACREALQAFAGELIVLHDVQDAPPPEQVTNRIRRVATIERFGERTADFFGALVNYWTKVYDLTQRQAKNALRENETLTDEDARRVVFHTAIVMYELSRLPYSD